MNYQRAKSTPKDDSLKFLYNHKSNHHSSLKKNYRKSQVDKENIRPVILEKTILLKKFCGAGNLSGIHQNPRTRSNTPPQDEIESFICQDLKLTPINKVNLKSINFQNQIQSTKIVKKSLKRHLISDIIRARMVNWMIEVINTYGLSRRTFFLFISIMDNYYKNCEPGRDSNDFFLSGIVSMILASKFEEQHSISLKSASKCISHNAFTEDKIRKKEQEILRVLKYDIIFNTPISVIDLYMAIAIDSIENCFKDIDGETWDILKKLKEGAVIYAIMATYEYKMQKYFPLIISLGALYAMAIKLTTVCSKYHKEIIGQAMKAFNITDKEIDSVELCAKGERRRKERMRKSEKE